jgi:multicomponent Na+:H+ antiporter subunit D
MGDTLLLWPVILPLAGAALAAAFHNRTEVQRIVGLLTIAATLAASVLLLGAVMSDGIQTKAFGNWMPPFGIVFVADRFSAAMVVISFVSVRSSPAFTPCSLA